MQDSLAAHRGSGLSLSQLAEAVDLAMFIFP